MTLNNTPPSCHGNGFDTVSSQFRVASILGTVFDNNEYHCSRFDV